MFENECQTFMSKWGNLKSTPKLTTQTHPSKSGWKGYHPWKVIYIYMFYQGTFEDDINISPGGISRYLICWERYRHRFLPPRPGQFETLFALLGVSPDSQCGLLALWLGQIGENFVGVFVKGYQVCNKGGVFPNAPKIQGTLKSKLPIDDDLVGEKPRRFFLSCGKPVGMLTTIVKTHLGTLYIMKCLHLGQYLKHVHLKQHP